MFYILTLPDAKPVYPYTLTDLKLSNPKTSFPTDMTNFDTSDWHCYPVQDTTPPKAEGKVAHRIAPIFVDGAWVEQWKLIDYTAEDTEAQWEAIRAERDQLLDKCDWWVTRAIEKNATISAEQQAYRDALRDITEQANPFDVTWPVSPSAGE